MSDLFVDYWAIYNGHIEQFEKLGDPKEAAICAAQLVRHYPGLVLAWQRYAELLHKAKLHDQADAAFERAMELDPLHPPLVLSYAERLNEKGAPLRALTILQPILVRRPYWEEATQLACTIFIALGRAEEGRALADARLSAYPNSFKVRLALLKILYRSQNSEAAAQLAICREIVSGNSPLAEELAELLLEVGKVDEALSVTHDIVSDGKGSLRAFRAYANALEQTGNTAGALAILESVGRKVSNREVGREARRLALPLRRSAANNSKRILMVSELPRIREAKFAQALKFEGWEASILYVVKPNYELDQFFSEAIQYSSIEEALAIADRLNIPIHHVFSLRADGTSSAFIREKIAFTIFDPCDIYDGLIYNDFQYHEPQRDCITQADALVCRDLSVLHASRLGKYRRPEKLLYFPEYCWGTPLPPVRDRSTDEIHIVQSGWIDIERYTGVKEGSSLDLITTLARAGIHIHLYQHLFARAEPLEEVYQDFLKLGQETGHVHLHTNIPLNNVVSEFQHYDLGLMTVSPQSGPVPPGVLRTMNPLSLRSSGSARAVDYLEAGLPVITSPELRHLGRIIKRWGVKIPLTPELLRQPRELLAAYCGSAVQLAARRKSEAYSLAVHAARLVQFYEFCLQTQTR